MSCQAFWISRDVDMSDLVRHFVIVLGRTHGNINVEQGHAICAIYEAGFGGPTFLLEPLNSLPMMWIS